MLACTLSLVIALTLGQTATSEVRPDFSGQWREAAASGSSPWGPTVSIRQREAGLMIELTPGAPPTEYRFSDTPTVERERTTSPCQQQTLSRKAVWRNAAVVLRETRAVHSNNCDHTRPDWPPASATDPETYQSLVFSTNPTTAQNTRVLFESEIVLSVSGDVLTVAVVRRSAGGGEIRSDSTYVRSGQQK